MSAPKRRIITKSSPEYPGDDSTRIQEKCWWGWRSVATFRTKKDGIQAALDFLEELKRIDRANGDIK